ncbi:hypothetical protein LUQ84_002918 [Hamiltosporidium tvaerminnensis]|nr:hypothetical protein LUQ84_002918 [Hamiltosporidium tvaerminnensis]
MKLGMNIYNDFFLIYLIKFSINLILNVNIGKESIVFTFFVKFVLGREIILVAKEDLNNSSDNFTFIDENFIFGYKKNDTTVLCPCNHEIFTIGIQCSENIKYFHFKLRKIIIQNPDEYILNSELIRKINDDFSMSNIIILDMYSYSEVKEYIKYLQNIDLAMSDISINQFSKIINFINELKFIDCKHINELISFIAFNTFIVRKEELKYDLKDLENIEKEYFSVKFVLKIFKYCFKFYFRNIEAIKKTIGINTESKNSLYTKLIKYHNKNEIPIIFSKETSNLLYKILINRNLYSIIAILFNRLNVKCLIIYGDNLHYLVPNYIFLGILPNRINKCRFIIIEQRIEYLQNYFKKFFNRTSLKKIELTVNYLTEAFIEALGNLQNLDFLKIGIFEYNNVILNSILKLLDRSTTIFIELTLRNIDFHDIFDSNTYKYLEHYQERISFGIFTKDLRNLKIKFKEIGKIHLITGLKVFLDGNLAKNEKYLTKLFSLKTLSINFLFKNQFFIKSKFLFLSKLDKIKSIRMSNIRINNNLLKYILFSKNLKRIYLKNVTFSTKINFLKYERYKNYTLEEFSLDKTENVPSGFFSQYLNRFPTVYFLNYVLIQTEKLILKFTLVMNNLFDSFKPDTKNISHQEYTFFPQKLHLNKVFFDSELFERLFMTDWNIIYLEEIYLEDLKIYRENLMHFTKINSLQIISLHSVIFADSNFSDIFLQISNLTIQVIILKNIEIHEVDLLRLNKLINLKILEINFCNFSAKYIKLLRYSHFRTLSRFYFRGYLFSKKLRNIFDENFSSNVLTK